MQEITLTIEIQLIILQLLTQKQTIFIVRCVYDTLAAWIGLLTCCYAFFWFSLAFDLALQVLLFFVDEGEMDVGLGRWQ